MAIGRFGTPEKSRRLLAPGDECPDCGKPMRMRYRKSDGNGFLGCSGFPNCRHTENEFRDPPADYKEPEKKPYNQQAAKDYKARNSAGAYTEDLTEFEWHALRDLVCDKVKSGKDDMLLAMLVKLERRLEKFKAVPQVKAAVDAAVPPCSHDKDDEPAEDF